MPIPMGSNATTDMNGSMSHPYPAQTKQVAGLVNGVPTDVMMISFAEKIMITITQNGRLAQWIHVPLESSTPVWANETLSSSNFDDDLLPLTHLTPTTILGGASPKRETMGQLYASQIASTIVTKNPDEKRLLVVGLGFAKVETERETYFDVVELVMKCL